MHFPVMDTAERDSAFVAHLAAERTRLHKAEVVRIRMLAAADQTRLFGHEPQMLLVAMAARFGDRKDALVDAGESGTFRRNRRGRERGSRWGRSWFTDRRDLGV